MERTRRRQVGSLFPVHICLIETMISDRQRKVSVSIHEYNGSLVQTDTRVVCHDINRQLE